ncbi:hypothetical protein FRB94_014595 [Tulasnella sp. JGI-2019a]|nr:hypothetical protein FRB94_014595 [Tulasnella sp. JGI-2019a]
MAGDEASCKSHTVDHIKDVLMKVIKLIRPEKFSACTSDSTGNTKKAREDIHCEFPSIIPILILVIIGTTWERTSQASPSSKM